MKFPLQNLFKQTSVWDGGRKYLFLFFFKDTIKIDQAYFIDYVIIYTYYIPSSVLYDFKVEIHLFHRKLGFPLCLEIRNNPIEMTLEIQIDLITFYDSIMTKLYYLLELTSAKLDILLIEIGHFYIILTFIILETRHPFLLWII